MDLFTKNFWIFGSLFGLFLFGPFSCNCTYDNGKKYTECELKEQFNACGVVTRSLDLHLQFKCSNTGKADFEILAAKYRMADRLNVASRDFSKMLNSVYFCIFNEACQIDADNDAAVEKTVQLLAYEKQYLPVHSAFISSSQICGTKDMSMI